MVVVCVGGWYSFFVCCGVRRVCGYFVCFCCVVFLLCGCCCGCLGGVWGWVDVMFVVCRFGCWVGLSLVVGGGFRGGWVGGDCVAGRGVGCCRCVCCEWGFLCVGRWCLGRSGGGD